MRKFVEYQTNINIFKEPLAVVFSMFYLVNDLWDPLRDILYPSLGIPIPRKRPNKSDLSKLLLNTFSNPAQMKEFIAAAPENVRAVWDALAWGDNLPLETLEKQLGFEIALVDENNNTRWRSNLVRRREFPFVVLIDTLSYHGGFNPKQPRRGVEVALPPEIRAAFRAHLPKPKNYDIEPVAEAPEAELSFRCDATALDDLRFLAEYIDADNLKLTKSKKIRMTCQREIASMMGGGELFNAIDVSTILPMLRVRLLVMFLTEPGKLGAQHLLNPTPEDPGKAFRIMLASAFSNPLWLHENLLDHLKGWTGYTKRQLENLFALFASLDEEKWTTEKNLISYADYRDLDYNIFDYNELWTNALRPDAKAWNRSYQQRFPLSEHIRDFHTLPLIHGMAFLLAALGFAEIRYNHPATEPEWERPIEKFLSPFGGLIAIRLTPIGAYAFGKSDQLEIDESARKRVHIVLNEQRLTLTCRDLDQTTELLIHDFTEKISDGCYRMTRKSLIRGCKTAADVTKRIERFKTRIPAEIPSLWDRFFAETTNNCVALRKRSRYLFYDLSDTPELRRHFLSDPLLRGKTVKTAGPGVAIKVKDLPAVSRHLAALGYLIE